jgi:predicted AlkP superfamily pyrophosphatase or phosphodiesterase
MRSRPIPRALWFFALAGGIVGLVVSLAGSLVLAIGAAVVCWAFGFAVIHWRSKLDARDDEGAADPSRRRFLAIAGFGGFALAAGGPALGWTVRHLSRPAARPIQEEMAHGLGAEYMELVRRAYHPGRSGDLQLLLAPFNSSNYSFESLHLAPLDPRTSHASTWMYLERVPLLVYGPGRIPPSDSVERVSLADLAPTAAKLMGFAGWPSDREGRPLPSIQREFQGLSRPPKVIVTFVIDGGGWNVLHQWPDSWPTLKRLMGQSANYRNAIMGSFPAVTACAHATIGTGAFPATHGITGHNIRDNGTVRKAYREEGNADPGDILVPTLADLWSNAKADLPWIGEIGYQVWHLGMIGRGGPSRTGDNRPVAIYFEERLSIHDWVPQDPDLYRMPTQMPELGTLAKHKAGFSPPDWDAEFAPLHAAVDCCSPPIVQFQGDVIASTLASEPIGQSGVTDLLYINYKTPDYTGHVYNMLSKWEGLVLEEVDRQLERLVAQLDQQFPNEYVLFVTADHGQCPTPDAVNAVRLDPIQLQEDIEREFGGGIGSVVQSVVPSEVYLYPNRLWDNGGATVEDVAVFLRDYRYRQNIGPYVPASLVEQNLLDSKEFAAVFGTTFLDTLRGADLARYGPTAFSDADAGLPAVP